MRRSLGVLLVGLAACAHVAPPSPPPLDSSAPFPAATPVVKTIPAGELGAEGIAAQWIELHMPPDANLFAYEHDVDGGRETWTLAQAGPKRLLRVRFDDGKKVAEAAWIGTATKEGMKLRLVEIRGNVRFTSETLVAECGRDVVCEDEKPSHQVTASLCAFEGDGIPYEETAWFAPGKGIDFTIGPCRTENTTRERILKRPRGYMQHDL